MRSKGWLENDAMLLLCIYPFEVLLGNFLPGRDEGFELVFGLYLLSIQYCPFLYLLW